MVRAACAPTGLIERALPSWASDRVGNRTVQQVVSQEGERPIDLVIDGTPFELDGRLVAAMTINGTIPGPVIKLKEGTEAVIRVTNRLTESSSIHWHGILLPPEMDGVPGVSFAGIKPGETFVYRFPVRQSGTYWCHSHSGGQELLGVYAPLVIEPAEPEPFRYQRDYTVLLSDWSFEPPTTIIERLKSQAGYYNYQKRTVGDFFDDVSNLGLSTTLGDRLEWGAMRMDPTDISDVTGSTFTYLMNGLSAASNWTAQLRAGERVRLRFIDGAAMTLFDVRIPGWPMTLVQADGQNVQPVEIEEFRIGPGEDVRHDSRTCGGRRLCYLCRSNRSKRLCARNPCGEEGRACSGSGTPEVADQIDGGHGYGDSRDGDARDGRHGRHGDEHGGSDSRRGQRSRRARRSDGHPGRGAARPRSSRHRQLNRCNGFQQPRNGAGNRSRKRRTPGYSCTPISRASRPGRIICAVPEREIELHLTGNMEERDIWGSRGKNSRKQRLRSDFDMASD